MVKKSIAAVAVALMLHGFAQAADSASADAGSAMSAAATAAGAGADTSGAAAAKSAAAPAGSWAAQGQLGLIVTSSNTTTKSGNGTFSAAHAMGRWTLSGGVAGLYASTGRYTTQQDTNASLQADLALSKRTFWFSSARWDRNLFTGFSYQESIASGGGFNFIQTPATALAGELGVGYRVEHPEILQTGPDGNVISRTSEPMERDAVLQAGFNYSHSITRSTKLVNALLVQYGSSDTTTTDNLALQVKVDESLSLAVGMQLVNNTNPPPGSARHTDTVMTVNLVYALKNPKLAAGATTPAVVSGFNLP
jgi:putative salt-induced outer membrane protein